MSNLTFSATFTINTGTPAEGLTLAEIDLYLTAVNNATAADTVIWDGTQNPTEEIDNIGAYARVYASADFSTYTYFGRATYTGATVLDSDNVTGVAGVAVDAIADAVLADVGEDVWTYASRTLTQSVASVASAVAGGTITITRGDTLSAEITDIGALTDYVSIDWSVKTELTDSDDDAILRVRLNATGLNDGLLRVNGAAAADETKGSIVVDDEPTGDITITVDATITDDLVVNDLYYDIQLIKAASVTTLSIGPATIVADVTRAVT